MSCPTFYRETLAYSNTKILQKHSEIMTLSDVNLKLSNRFITPDRLELLIRLCNTHHTELLLDLSHTRETRTLNENHLYRFSCFATEAGTNSKDLAHSHHDLPISHTELQNSKFDLTGQNAIFARYVCTLVTIDMPRNAFTHHVLSCYCETQPGQPDHLGLPTFCRLSLNRETLKSDEPIGTNSLPFIEVSAPISQELTNRLTYLKFCKPRSFS